MKNSSKTLDGPETKPQQITGQEFTNSIPSKKANGYQKRKLTLLVTLAITFAAFLMSACERRTGIS